MILGIDAGNTNTVYAIFDADGVVLGEWRCGTDENKTADELAVWLLQLIQLHRLDPRGIEGAIISTVVPGVLFNLRLLIRKYLRCPFLIVSPGSVDLGIKVLLDRPEEVGADRLVNAIGAYRLRPEAQVVVDFGTATTFDVIDDAGDYLGGCIAPGVNLSLEALHLAAAQLPRIAVGRPDRVIGKTTVQAMRSGVYWGYVGLIEETLRRISQEFGSQLPGIATGGLASLFYDACQALEHLEPQLTLIGLFTIYQRNSARLLNVSS